MFPPLVHIALFLSGCSLRSTFPCPVMNVLFPSGPCCLHLITSQMIFLFLIAYQSAFIYSLLMRFVSCLCHFVIQVVIKRGQSLGIA